MDIYQITYNKYIINIYIYKTSKKEAEKNELDDFFPLRWHEIRANEEWLKVYLLVNLSSKEYFLPANFSEIGRGLSGRPTYESSMDSLTVRGKTHSWSWDPLTKMVMPENFLPVLSSLPSASPPCLCIP